MTDTVCIFLLILEAALALWLLWREKLLVKPWAAVLCTVLVALAFSLRGASFDYETLDYQNFLTRWVDYFRSNGGFRALKTPIGNYNIPYLYFLALFSYLPVRDLYLIKSLSVLFDVLLAWAAMQLVGRTTRQPLMRSGVFFAVLFWPTVYLNGALWGQCDSIYVAFGLLGLWLALDDKPIGSMMLMAISFGFKLQAVFLLPICVVLLIYGKYKWWHFLIFPVTYVLLVLPAVLLGRPFWDTILLYFDQTGSVGDGLNYNSPSIFAIFWRIPAEQQSGASTIGIIAAALYMLDLLAVAFVKRRQLSDRSVLALALLLTVGIPFLLPHMHDRYFYAADVLALVLAFAMPPLLLVAPLVEFASFLGYYAYLKMRYLLYMYYGSYALILALVLAAIGLALSFGSAVPKKASRKRKRT